jgi:hypothetical protein
MARAGTLKHREQFRANVENLNEGHEVQLSTRSHRFPAPKSDFSLTAQDDFFESTPWRGAADKRDTLFQDEDLELPLVGFLDAQTLKKGALCDNTKIQCHSNVIVALRLRSFRELTRPTVVLDADKGDDLFRAEPSPGKWHSPPTYSHSVSVWCTCF